MAMDKWHLRLWETSPLSLRLGASSTRSVPAQLSLTTGQRLLVTQPKWCGASVVPAWGQEIRLWRWNAGCPDREGVNGNNSIADQLRSTARGKVQKASAAKDKKKVPEICHFIWAPTKMCHAQLGGISYNQWGNCLGGGPHSRDSNLWQVDMKTDRKYYIRLIRRI